MVNVHQERITQTAEILRVSMSQQITNIYKAYLEDPIIIHMISPRYYPSIEIINHSPLFSQQFGEIALKDWHGRAFGLGVIKADSDYDFRKGTPEEKIIACIIEFESSYSGNNPQYPKGFDQLGNQIISFIMTGKYPDEFNKPTDIEKKVMNNQNLYRQLRELYYIGARLNFVRIMFSHV